MTGLLHLFNKTPIDWFSKLQSTVETATFGSNMYRHAHAQSTNHDLRTTLRYLGYLFRDHPLSSKITDLYTIRPRFLMVSSTSVTMLCPYHRTNAKQLLLASPASATSEVRTTQQDISVDTRIIPLSGEHSVPLSVLAIRTNRICQPGQT